MRWFIREKSSKKVKEDNTFKGIWHLQLLGMLAVMLAINIWMHNKQSSKLTNSTLSQGGKTQENVTIINDFPGLKPLTHYHDSINISIVSKDNIFDPISFINVSLDPVYMVNHKDALKVTRKLSLESCYATNCSAHVSIVWSIKGQFFNTDTSLIRYFSSKEDKKRHLIGRALTDKNVTTDDGTSDLEYTPFLQPVLTLSPVLNFSTSSSKGIANFTPNMHNSKHGPVLYINNFWHLRKHMQKLTKASINNQTLTVELSPLTPLKLAFYEKFDESMREQIAMGLSTDESLDDMKSIFLDNNPYFLILTALITVLHMVFEYLALANDVKFWRGRKDFKGLSLRTVFINCYFQTVIFLYLYDTNETSWTILFPSGIGVLMEYWKIIQCITFVKDSAEGKTHQHRIDEAGGNPSSGKVRSFSVLGYKIKFRDTYDKKTRKHDETAVRWLIYCMAPILFGYCVYSLIYNEHKNWYSFSINTQVQFIYFFGFAAMTPQIFVNYKLKSVGQLPWRTFVFKALNTVIDDFFAFIIQMPWLHRLACFRDDIVFAILLYQRWIYPVDTSRIGDDEEMVDESITITEQGEPVKLSENSKKNN
ncbi:unnamed protein product [Phytomonas sp. Hart1]|nr:unnamed protein product [Phytomonas sp. Hart1]|eukprot:CCW67652.1 unnamed protein product [Phytomonas sp. isolate Hart1]